MLVQGGRIFAGDQILDVLSLQGLLVLCPEADQSVDGRGLVLGALGQVGDDILQVPGGPRDHAVPEDVEEAKDGAVQLRASRHRRGEHPELQAGGDASGGRLFQLGRHPLK